MLTSTALETIQRQAKRLRNCLGVSLTTAKQVLAQGPYGCSTWADLQSRLKSGQAGDGPLLLAELPESIVARAFFARSLGRLASVTSQQIITDGDLPKLCETLRYVFAVPGEPISLHDMLEPLCHVTWQPTSVGADHMAVIESRVRVNNVDLLLVGTRIFWPRLFTFDSAITVEPRMAEPIGNELLIMWEVEAWYQASREYLLEYQRDDNWDEPLDLAIPAPNETPRMILHRRWFTESLKQWARERFYNDDGEEFIPYVHHGNAYLIFGIPCPIQDSSTCPRSQSISFPGTDSNEYQLASVDGQLLQIERLKPPKKALRTKWLYSDYYKDLCAGLLDKAVDAGWLSAPKDGWGDLLFATPACQHSLEQQLRVSIHPVTDDTLFTLRTDDPSLATEVLMRASAGQLMYEEHEDFGPRYSMQINLAKDSDCHGLSLSMHIVEEELTSWANLLSSSVLTKSGNRVMHLSIQPDLINLVGRVSLKLLKQAVLEGIVLRSKGIHQHLKQPIIRSGKLGRKMEADLRDTQRLSDELFETGFFAGLRSTRYKR